MYKVTGKKNGIVWDAENNKPLAKFAGGVFETENKSTAEKLKKLGYAVEGLEDEKDPSPYAGMDVEQLKAYAAENGYDIGNATSVNGIIKKIEEAKAGGGGAGATE